MLIRALKSCLEPQGISMNFARRVFLVAGLLGVLAVLPMYFLEDTIGRYQPPAITHPIFFYGFLGVTLSWQVGFLVIARDPARFRPLMIPAMMEKATFGFAAVILFAMGRAPATSLGAGLFDLTLGVLFVAAFVKTRAVNWSGAPGVSEGGR
jgi:hypothetical protein